MDNDFISTVYAYTFIDLLLQCAYTSVECLIHRGLVIASKLSMSFSGQ